MKRLFAVLGAVLSGALMLSTALSTAGAYAVVAADKYGGYIPGRPSVLTPEMARQVLVIYGLATILLLVLMIILIIVAVRTKPRSTT